MSEEDRAQDVELNQREADIKAQMTKNPPKPIKIDCSGCGVDDRQGHLCPYYKQCVDDVVRVREANKRNGLVPRW